VKKIVVGISFSLLLIFVIFLLFFFPFKTKVVLYTYDSNNQSLRRTDSEIEVSLAERLVFKNNLYKKVILKLIEESDSNKDHFPIPKGTRLLSVSLKDEVAYVNFSEEFKRNHPGGSLGEILMIYSIVDTLTEFPEIKKVQILIGGAVVETLAGHIDLTSPLERDLSMVK